MKKGFYPKLAFDGIRKNKRVYLPYILTCIGMVMMQYIISFIRYSDTLLDFPGASTAREMIGMGGGVIAVFAGIFLFYTNSFLIRHRKKEFGLYNILGMDKKNVGRLLFWENLMIAAGSIVTGIAAGIAFSKFAELGLINILKGDITYTLSISFKAVFSTIKVFCVIYVLLFLNALRQVKFSSAISLLRSENVGEKPPKGNWFIGILGVLILGAAYYIAISIQDPVSAVMMFFTAAVMVIVGTYLIMIAGSVLFCRILQKKKNYYYKANHFVSVSSMVYRMKRNGAGLASICILATMVLVMISSTATLYIGSEDTLNSRYPREINTKVTFAEPSAEEIDAIRSDVMKEAGAYGIVPQNTSDYIHADIVGIRSGNTIEYEDFKNVNATELSEIYQVIFVSLEDYNKQFGKNETLDADEVLVFPFRSDYNEDTLKIGSLETFRVKKQIDEFFENGQMNAYAGSTLGVVVSDFHKITEELPKRKDSDGSEYFQYDWEYAFDTGMNEEKQISMTQAIRTTLDAHKTENEQCYRYASVDSREVERDSYYGLFGGLFYLGIILSIVFVFATVLIIYYKQVSEGYEDQSRFEIMQKVGMTKKEIRRTINSQLLTVFFLPLIGAGLHLAFAFPLMRKILLMFNLNNVMLFVITTIVCFLVFALFYTIVYRMTSNAYYKIVSGAKEK